jgi:MEDS: MEthanogen/methylotroph, DcmR Sensory domain
LTKKPSLSAGRSIAAGQSQTAARRHATHGHIEILQGTEWYLQGDQFYLNRITSGWSEKLSGALAMGCEGMRVSGNAFWFESKHWKEFCEYEHELDRTLAGASSRR